MKIPNMEKAEFVKCVFSVGHSLPTARGREENFA